MNLTSILKSIKNFLQNNLISIILFISITTITIGGISSTSQSTSAEEMRIARDSLFRAVISCYALEGRYPESYDYIKEHYGVRINEEKFVVYYDIFASNIMPDITILERQVAQ